MPETKRGGGDHGSKAWGLRDLAAWLAGRAAPKNSGGPGAPGDAPASLLAQLANVDEIRSRLDEIQRGIERHAARSVQREQALGQRHERLVVGLLLLLDYFEEAERGGKASDELTWFRNKVRVILGDDGIEELSVRIGEAFQGEFHRHVGERPDERPRGAVLEVTRRGYWRPSGTERAVVRAAEVIVSSGRAAAAGDPGGQEAGGHG